MGMREIGGEVGKDLVHMLRSFTPGGPKVHDDQCATPDNVIQLFFRLNIFHRPTHFKISFTIIPTKIIRNTD